MRISSALIQRRLSLGSLLIGAGPGFALEAPALLRAPPPVSAGEALRGGVRDYDFGRQGGAVQALEFAAEKGIPLAHWKLGAMSASGDGVPHDDLKAFEFFSNLADKYADERPDCRTPCRQRLRGTRHLFPRRHQGHVGQAESRRERTRCSLCGVVFRQCQLPYNVALVYLEALVSPPGGVHAPRAGCISPPTRATRRLRPFWCSSPLPAEGRDPRARSWLGHVADAGPASGHHCQGPVDLRPSREGHGGHERKRAAAGALPPMSSNTQKRGLLERP